MGDLVHIVAGSQMRSEKGWRVELPTSIVENQMRRLIDVRTRFGIEYGRIERAGTRKGDSPSLPIPQRNAELLDFFVSPSVRAPDIVTFPDASSLSFS